MIFKFVKSESSSSQIEKKLKSFVMNRRQEKNCANVLANANDAIQHNSRELGMKILSNSQEFLSREFPTGNSTHN